MSPVEIRIEACRLAVPLAQPEATLEKRIEACGVLIEMFETLIRQALPAGVEEPDEPEDYPTINGSRTN